MCALDDELLRVARFGIFIRECISIYLNFNMVSTERVATGIKGGERSVCSLLMWRVNGTDLGEFILEDEIALPFTAAQMDVEVPSSVLKEKNVDLKKTFTFAF